MKDRPVSKGPLLSHTVAMESRDRDDTLPCYCVCVPRTRNRYSWFQRLFYSQGSSELKCLSVLFNDTSLQTITHREQRTNVKQINLQPISALFALADGNWRLWKFSLHMVKAKSITAKIQAIILQPPRKYYISGLLVLSLIFLSSHCHRDTEASVGTCAFHCHSHDERGFPI